MPAGLKYDLQGQAVERELCNQKTIYRLAGGFNLVDENVPDGAYIPHLAPLAIDFATRTAKVVKNVKIYEAATNTATEYKVYKDSLVYVGMFLGTGTKGGEIAAIDKTNAEYDVITVAATIGAALKVGDVLFEAGAVGGTTSKNTANFLNYARVKKEAGATVTAVGRAFEIQEAKLYTPISAKDKVALGALFMFV